jgi:hypothetical protein
MKGGLAAGNEKQSEYSTLSSLISSSHSGSKPKPDYVLVFCYILIYLEVGWLIYMLLRSYSRD